MRALSLATVAGVLSGAAVFAPLSVTSALAASPAPAGDADLDGDNLTDLLTTGGEHGLASGLWLASGQGDGRLAAVPTDIGAHGNGVFHPGLPEGPADFDGAQVVTGHFAGGALQDILVYYPPTHSRNPGGAVILHGTGDGSVIRAELDQSFSNINAGTFSGMDWDDFQTINSPSQLVNAGAHQSTVYPDLIGIAGKDDGSSFLTYYANHGGIGGYNDLAVLPVRTPTGGTDWNTWTIATAQTGTGTALFLRQAATGKLFLWNDFVRTDAGTAEYASYLLSDNFHTGEDVTLHAADVNSDGIGDLWTVGDGAEAVAWLVSDLDSTTSTGTLTAQPSQHLNTD
ncbi:hypothetical protein [Actinoplanes regularis]|uniref:hypothetical protein n=1 Tax=Actinoplanes regularis TaxID=52697 RepID=UPI002556055F|nr:hypothetical protein [Actinoplanes regularis]GLW31643.1 hypothetical protein Areg01_45830 [Actinoplanes regularis]